MTLEHIRETTLGVLPSEPGISRTIGFKRRCPEPLCVFPSGALIEEQPGPKCATPSKARLGSILSICPCAAGGKRVEMAITKLVFSSKGCATTRAENVRGTAYVCAEAWLKSTHVRVILLSWNCRAKRRRCEQYKTRRTKHSTRAASTSISMSYSWP